MELEQAGMTNEGLARPGFPSSSEYKALHTARETSEVPDHALLSQQFRDVKPTAKRLQSATATLTVSTSLRQYEILGTGPIAEAQRAGVFDQHRKPRLRLEIQ